MNRVTDEFIPPLLLEERLRQARREALLAAAAPDSRAPIAAPLGRLLVRLGRRLEARGGRRVPPSPRAALEACPWGC